MGVMKRGTKWTKYIGWGDRREEMDGGKEGKNEGGDGRKAGGGDGGGEGSKTSD